MVKGPQFENSLEALKIIATLLGLPSPELTICRLGYASISHDRGTILLLLDVHDMIITRDHGFKNRTGPASSTG